MNLRPGSALRWTRRIGSNPAYRFALLFAAFLGVAGFGFPLLRTRFRASGDAMIAAVARLEYLLFRAFSPDVSLSGTRVVYGGFAVEIIEECTAVYEILIFAAAVLAFPTGWRQKAIGLGAGIPALYAINLLRIAMLIYVGRHHPAAFDFMHIYFWQATLILMITSVWLLWILAVVRGGETGRPAAP